jgi:hypothetical protein
MVFDAYLNSAKNLDNIDPNSLELVNPFLLFFSLMRIIARWIVVSKVLSVGPWRKERLERLRHATSGRSM